MSSALLKALKDFSPAMNKLVNKAIQDGMQIMTIEQANRIFRRRWPDSLESVGQTSLGTLHIPEIGLGKTIGVSLEDLREFIEKGNLGVIERGFAHEMGHILNDIAEKRPDCCRDCSKNWPCYFYCAYREISAERIGLEQLKRVCRWNIKTHLVLFGGQKVTLFQLLASFGYPYKFLREAHNCKALGIHCFSKCPKENKITVLIRKITHLLK